MAINAKQVNELRQKTGAGIMDCKRALQETDGDVDRAITYLREKGMASAGKKSARVAAEGKVEIGTSADVKTGAQAEINCETDFVARGDDFQAFCKHVVDRALSESATDPSDYDGVRKDLVTKTGENVVVRRVARFSLGDAEHGRVEAYQHMGGKIGVLVEVACGSADGAKAAEFSEFCREVAMHVAAASPQYLKKDEVPADVQEAEKDIYKNQALGEGKPEKVVDKMVEGRLRKWFGEFCLLEQPWVREQKMTIAALAKQTADKIGTEIEIRRYSRFQLGEGIEKKSDDLAAEVQKQIEASK